MYRLFSIILLLIPLLLPGQSLLIDFDWIESDSIPYFQNALYDNEANSLPQYIKNIPWDKTNGIPDVRIESFSAEALPLHKIDPAVVKELPIQPEISCDLATANKQQWLLLKVNPFIRDLESGKVERLKQITLKISSSPSVAVLKSARTAPYRSTSVLSSGFWYKIAIEHSGIHRLTYNQLVELGLKNPANVRIYGAGAKLLPEKFSNGHIDDLDPVPVYMKKGDDNLFGPGDYILFYAQGPVEWNYNEKEKFFDHELHTYSRRGYYFLTDEKGPADQAGTAELSDAPETDIVAEYDELMYTEQETYNLLHSGREWYGTNYSVNLKSNHPYSIPDPIENDTVRIKVAGAARSNEISQLRITADGTTLGTLTIPSTNLSRYTDIYAYEKRDIFNYVPKSGVLTIGVEYLRPNTNSEAWLNFITVNTRSRLNMVRDQIIFRDSRSFGEGHVSKFRVSNAPGDLVIWDITTPGQPLRVNYSLAGQVAEFKVKTDELRTFVAFKPNGNFPTPIYNESGLGLIENQDLHAIGLPEMIIIYPEEFREQAERLAEFRRENDGLDVVMVEQTTIFNEFSSGTPDVSAVRNFLKMLYDRAEQPEDMTRYLLLFGDGSFDNRDITKQNPNKLLTYQSVNSLSPTSSYVSDDYFGLLDSAEILGSGLLDIGIGRLPVSTVEEAEYLVEKIISYSSDDNLGEWRNYVCFIGDDEDSNTHMKQADELATNLETNYPNFNVNKIYLDAYPQITTPTGDRYPDVSRLINEQVEKGALIVNYTGHGGPNGLAHEQILTRNHINTWKNGTKLPLFMTATCEFSRYDEYDFLKDLEETSAGEEVLLNPSGGGIALFTTTRLVYSAPNHALNERFYEIIFEKDDQDRPYRLGDIIAYSKNMVGSGVNKLNFTLLGDPSQKLVTPENFIITDSINGLPVGELTDTLSALDYVNVSGHVEDASGQILNEFEGLVNPIVYDKERNIETLGNDGFLKWKFNYRNSILYKGNASVQDGRFSFGFYIPKDINYSYGNGKITYYGSNAVTDANGSTSAIYVGGMGDDFSSDNILPELDVYMNDTNFRSGGITDSNPELLVKIWDNFGINTTGNGIGHDITSTLDGDRYNAIILNDFFQSELNSFNSGTVRYPYTDLQPGRHEIIVKVWDIHNNSAEKSIEFIVVESLKMLIEQLYNYPNPFIDRTWFNIEHNRPDVGMELEIKIYNLSGKLITVIKRQIPPGGYRLEPVEWDGTGTGGYQVGSGVYVYNIILRTSAGEETTDSGKLIISR